MQGQEAAQQLNELSQVLSDPVRGQQFFAEWQRMMQQSGYRPDFPGQGQQSPMLIQPASPNDIEYWYGRFQELNNAGLPPDPKLLRPILQGWDEFPEDAMLNLVQAFPIF